MVGVGDVVFTDRKNHASLIDGCRLSAPTSAIIPTRLANARTFAFQNIPEPDLQAHAGN